MRRQTIEEFKSAILDHYNANGRDFPWRYKGKGKSPSPWGVVVSEFMLQQTQTSRVLLYWEKWMNKWPTPKDLADAPLQTVLKEWSGLGYNRRAKNLKECAAVIAKEHGGIVPQTPKILLTLPGIGPYTAGAISCFAWNYPVLFIETNIRSVFIHFFFNGKSGVKDTELFPILEKTLDYTQPRIWYYALMDYGAELKKVMANPNRQSAAYTKQSRFEGSFRQIRGALVKTLCAKGPLSAAKLKKEVESTLTDLNKADYYRALKVLQKEMMVAEERGVYRIGG